MITLDQVLAAARALPEGFGLMCGPARSLELYGPFELRGDCVATYYGHIAKWDEAWVLTIDRLDLGEVRAITRAIDALSAEICRKREEARS